MGFLHGFKFSSLKVYFYCLQARGEKNNIRTDFMWHVNKRKPVSSDLVKIS